MSTHPSEVVFRFAKSLAPLRLAVTRLRPYFPSQTLPDGGGYIEYGVEQLTSRPMQHTTVFWVCDMKKMARKRDRRHPAGQHF